MPQGFAVATANSLLDAVFNQTNYTAPTAIWMQLHTASPGAAGTTAVAGNNVRKDVTAAFPAAAGGSVTNNVAVTWTSVSTSETYTHFSIWSLVTAGVFLASGTVTANPVTTGDTATVASGAATATLNVAS